MGRGQDINIDRSLEEVFQPLFGDSGKGVAGELELEVEPVHVTDVLQFNDKTFMNEGWLASHG